jgi:hypothetical protein
MSRGKMTPIMDRRLRRAPDAEWVLMYRLGLSQKRIAELVAAKPATVGYHLVIARRRDPELEVAHLAATDTVPVRHPSPKELARMEELIAWVTAEGHLPNDRSVDRTDRSMARWLSARRREAAEGTLDQAYSHGLAHVPGWTGNHREMADEARWHARLGELAAFREEGHDWPRHHHYDSEREHTLGVWIHTQRYKRRRGDLEPVKVNLLDTTVPGWQTGRTRGRSPRR